jgi:protein subunit release factor A
MKATIEIRPAEGGEDAQLFAADLVRAYEKLAERRA